MNKQMVKERLVELLKNENPIELLGLHILMRSSIDKLETFAESGQHFYYVYSRRLEHAVTVNLRIDVTENLLDSLKKVADRSIRLISGDSEYGTAIFFTDDAISHLLGLMIIKPNQ